MKTIRTYRWDRHVPHFQTICLRAAEMDNDMLEMRTVNNFVPRPPNGLSLCAQSNDIWFKFKFKAMFTAIRSRCRVPFDSSRMVCGKAAINLALAYVLCDAGLDMDTRNHVTSLLKQVPSLMASNTTKYNIDTSDK